MENVIYSATATAWGGRQGRVISSDNRLDVNLSSPAAMGGDDGPGTNPEQMFAAGYAACYHSALKAIARSRTVDVSESAVSVTISLVGSIGAGSLGMAGRIEAELPGLDPAVAHDLMEAAHKLCPYSAVTRGNMDVELVVVES